MGPVPGEIHRSSRSCNTGRQQSDKMGGMDGFDLILVGGGLQNGLIALAVRSRWPHARIALVERGDHVGG